QAPKVNAGVAKLSLQRPIHPDPQITDIAEEITDPRLDRQGHRLVVHLGNRLRRIGIHRLIDGEHGAIEAFIRVARVFLSHYRSGKPEHHHATSSQLAPHAPPRGPEHQSHFLSCPSAALLNRNWLIIFSRTTADCVLAIVSPAFNIFSSPPTSRPTYCSPSNPAVWIEAKVSFGNW